MKRNTTWVLIAVIMMVISALLIPTTHANRSNAGRPSENIMRDKSLPGSRPELAHRLNPRAQAQTQKLVPVSAQAVKFAVSEPVTNLHPTEGVQSDVESEPEAAGREKNELNAREAKTQRPGVDKLASIDGALQASRPIASETPGTPSLTFEGLSDADNVGLIGGAVAPSDENIDVGPNDVVQTVNDAFKIWDKNGVQKTPPTLISSLFGNLGGICATTDRGDPVVLYDRLADRWFITQFAFLGNGQAPPFHQCVAVSRTGDPAGAYFTYDFVTPGANFPDYGKFGVWPDGYYMTVNQFMEPGDVFNGMGAYALDRKKMLVGDPTAAFIYFDLNLTSFPEGFNSTVPSDHDGLQAPPVGAPNVFAYLLSDEFEGPPFNTDSIRLFNFHADFTTPANSTFLERSESPIAVAAYDPRSAPGRSDVKQPPPSVGTDALDSIQYHLMYRLQYRNRGGIETLVSSTTVNVSGVNPTNRNLYQAGVRYFELQRSTPGGAFLLRDNATFSPDAGNPATGVNRWLPSAAIDHQGNLAVSYSASSTSVFPSIWYAGRDFNALGGLTGEQHLFDGTAVQLGSSNRWGDYQSLQLDPSDDCTFWTTNQYYNVNSSFNWRTRIGRFKFPTCQAPAQGTVNGTITACDSGVPISGAIVELSNGFSGTTRADGTYSIVVAPGTYSVTVTNSGRSCNASASSIVTVTDGGAATFNTCLAGTANPLVDRTIPNATVISGGNGNGIIDANECNALTVILKNPGCAPARSVMAHLATSTPGVTIAQSNAPYADIAIDGTATNTIPFSITTSPSFVCGTTIAFTLTTEFTGGSTVSSFSLPTCTETLPDITVTGSIDPSDAKSTQGRIGRNGIGSVCGVAKACPGALGAGGRSFDQYSFVNQGAQTACTAITLSAAAGVNLIGSAYLGSYNPADTTFCVNYLGDPGGSINGDATWRVDVPPGGTLVVVVMEVNAGTPSTPYSVKVSGLRAAPVDGGGPCQTCTVTPPANITVNNAPGTCGAIVNYPAPATSGTCGVITTSPASGSTFPVGTTTVNVFESNTACSLVYGVTTANNLVSFNADTPGTITSSVAITGLQTGENILGIDFRPANGLLYGLGSSSRLYTINRTTGVATAVGSGSFTPALNGVDFGFDFNPTVDRIRVVSNMGQNLRLNPDTGAVAAVDTNLNPGSPNVVGAAYKDNFAGSTVTTLYDIDSSTDMLVRQGGVNGSPSPNNGTLTNIGPLGVDTSGLVGFDISQCSATAYASLTVGGVSGLYTINLNTGAATLTGTIGGGTNVRDIATPTSLSTPVSSFTVTVLDTQAPIITCPANINVTAPPNVTSVPVTLPAPTVTDNCSATFTYNPASGSNFNLGTTTVTATATDGAGNSSTCTFMVTVTQPDAVLFSAPTYSVNENGGSLIATVVRTGGSATTATVDFATSNNPSASCGTPNGFASERCDYLAEAGTLTFAPGETSKTIQVFINNDAYVEGAETFVLTLSNPVGTTAGVQNVATVTIGDNDSSPVTTNPIDDPAFFVIDQYHDFLNRDPDAGGLAFWTGKITACGSNAACINQQRVSVSAAFFTSPEFQGTGFFVYRLYKGSLGLKPTYPQFVFDRSQLHEGPNLEADKQALTLTFVQRSAFTTKYPVAQSGNAFIDALLANVQASSGINLTSKKPELSSEYLAGVTQADSRARVVRKLIDYPEYLAAEFNSAFVQMQYFGYLNRDIDQGGFDFWLSKLNTGASPTSMVCAFITSPEYQQKYNSVVTRTNANCP